MGTNLPVAHLQLKYLLYVILLVLQCTKNLLSKKPIQIVENDFIILQKALRLARAEKCQSVSPDYANINSEQIFGFYSCIFFLTSTLFLRNKQRSQTQLQS